jgi:hypothetical protein
MGMSSAMLSACNRYRYLLTRGEMFAGHACGVVMLNPSTADADKDDSTVRKLRGHAGDWGYPGFVVANCYAWRATDPKALREVPDPVGPDNDAYLMAVATLPLVVVAWGKNALPERARHVEGILRSSGRPLWCLGVNLDGSPKHPLYVPFAQKLVEFPPVNQ